MYNCRDFGGQIDSARDGSVFDVGRFDSQDTALEALRRGYVPPPDLKILSCYEAPNGEWVPFPAGKEERLAD